MEDVIFVIGVRQREQVQKQDWWVMHMQEGV